ncbi:fimbrial protein [Nitrosomonas stercoris]|uniref:Fimbrial protein n=1 Tax=Nitrosomonas stercoris TaxID=1444684 RepID=A0A4Y1YT19_9PROT|nr:fimbrial protein [Nitrosomonas stercoris]
MQQVQKGFTLIELMIVVAIIGILAAVAIPAYSDYQAKSKVTAGLAEISAGKTAYEDFVNNGGTINTPSDIGLASSTGNCSDISVATDGITCKLTNAPAQVNGKTIALDRTNNGVWSCSSTDIDEKYLPKSCQADAGNTPDPANDN